MKPLICPEDKRPCTCADKPGKGCPREARRTLEIVNVADLQDPADPAGRSYRHVNAEKTHRIALGALVELENGARLFVVVQGRDCDKTPLYWLAADMPEMQEEDGPERIRWERSKWVGGYGEEDLTVIRALHSQ